MMHLVVQVIHQKSRISYDDLANDLCPVSISVFLITWFLEIIFHYDGENNF